MKLSKILGFISIEEAVSLQNNQINVRSIEGRPRTLYGGIFLLFQTNFGYCGIDNYFKAITTNIFVFHVEVLMLAPQVYF